MTETSAWGGSIIVVMTRWSVRDLTAKVLKKQAEGGADQWEVVEFPAIFPDTNNVLWSNTGREKS